jgi:hypothetical protein
MIPQNEIDQINEENGMILELFGYTLERCNNGFAWDCHNKVPENKTFKVHGLLQSHTWIHTSENKGQTHRVSNFKTDWNWLMLLYYKCEDIAASDPEKWISAYDEQFHSMGLFNKIDWVYEACLYFIKYYNDHKND